MMGEMMVEKTSNLFLNAIQCIRLVDICAGWFGNTQFVVNVPH